MFIRATALSVSLIFSFTSFATAQGVAEAAPLPASAAGGAPYKVGGPNKNKVDPNTLRGWKTWRAQACERCHGASQEGLVGPSLVNSLKTLTKDEFKTTLKNGRIEKGMPNFGGIPNVVDNLDNLYAYLKGRSDGAIAAGRLEAIDK
ncbi:MAG: cytochrome c [Polaromonas sp.]